MKKSQKYVSVFPNILMSLTNTSEKTYKTLEQAPALHLQCVIRGSFCNTKPERRNLMCSLVAFNLTLTAELYAAY